VIKTLKLKKRLEGLYGKEDAGIDESLNVKDTLTRPRYCHSKKYMATLKKNNKMAKNLFSSFL